MGIPHFSALSEKRKNAFLLNPHMFSYQEKIDGSNLKFKLDTTFPWAMRKTVSGPVYQSPNDWGTDSWVTGFRASHSALIEFMPHMLKTGIYKSGEIIEMEMLFKDTPNTIIYNDLVNTLVVYHPQPHFPYISNTWVELHDVPVTTDGFTFNRVTKGYPFIIRTLPTYVMTDEHQLAVNDITKHTPKDEIPGLLVQYFSGPESASPLCPTRTRPEGFVFRHVDEGWMFKLVDREWFTAQNTKNYLVRNKLFKSPRGYKNSVMDTFWASIAEGKPVSYAVDKATDKLDQAWKHYVTVDQATQEPHIHQRNLEAFASLRYQLRDYTINGVTNEQ